MSSMFATAEPWGPPAIQVPTAWAVAAVAQRLRALRHGRAIARSDFALWLGPTQLALARFAAGHQELSLAALKQVALEVRFDVTFVISQQWAI